jgi:recombination protein RecA
MTGVKEAVAGLKKKYGDKTVTYGITLYEAERIPTGVFEIDYATGGGIPRGRLTEIYGPESSCKTNVVLRTIRNAQAIWPDQFCVFIDAENSGDGSWFGKMGVNMDKLIYIRPDYGEQVIEAVEKLIEAVDVSLIAIDSIAALVGINELEADAEKVTPGNATQLIQRLTKRAVSAFGRTDKAYEDGERPTHPPALIFINQIRMALGVMYGNPEKTPGGQAPKFAAGLRLRVYGKNVIDNKISKTMPVRKDVSVILQKWKVPVLAREASFEMAMIKHNEMQIGECDSWNTVESLLKHFGMLVKDPKKGWWLNTDGGAAENNGVLFPTLIALRAQYRAEFSFRNALHNDLFLAGRSEMENDDEMKAGEVDEATGELKKAA